MSEAVRHRVDADGILRIVFDSPGEKVNTFNEPVLRHLDQLLQEAARRDDVRAVLFGSAKPGMFVAGMDVDEIAAVTDAHVGAEGARMGQSVFQRIDDLDKPSAVAINGTCLGGGLEMALACDFRLAADDPQVRIGLPEVQLGIIPGFGGTQRMPRRIGLRQSLALILPGKAVPARKAKKIGLVDAVVPAAYLEREAVALLRRALDEGTERVRASVAVKRGLADRAIESIGPLRRWALNKARQQTSKKAAPRDYPAPFRAIEAIEAAYTMPLRQGLDLEARIEGELIPTATSKNLIWLFKSNNALKNARAVQAAPRKVRKIGVLGAGVMGGGIAQLAADRDLPVRLRDIRQDAILTAYRTAEAVWARKVQRKRMTPAELEAKRGYLSPTLDLTGFRHADIVVEAVVENLDVKRKVLAELEPHLGERAVFASNTSSIPISEIAAHALRPERVVGMHFFNPVHRMPLIEIIAGRRTSPEAVATVHALAIRMGKTPVIVEDSPGFLVNRVLTLYLFEALIFLQEGVRMQAVDAAMKAFGMPMGPFELMDQVGLDTAAHVGDVLQQAFGERIGARESILHRMVEQERLGAKNGKGFYRYRNGKPTTPDPAVYELAGSPAPRDLPPETLQERMVLAMVNEAALCLEEGVARSPRDVDMAMVMGTGFPPFRGGLLRHADATGIPIVVDRLSRLADAHGARFRPPDLLDEMVRTQSRFYPGDPAPGRDASALRRNP